MLTRVRRFDMVDLGSPRLTPELKALLAPPHRTDEGYLIVEGFGARTGIQVYRDADGGMSREYRPPGEVFDSVSMETWEGKPVTPEHPPFFTTPDEGSWCGTLLAATPLPEHGLVKVRLILHDAWIIDLIEMEGYRQLSMGYWAGVTAEPGIVPDDDPHHPGERYDARQHTIRINHIAVVDRARAGQVASLRLDHDGHATPPPSPHPQEPPTMKITINGVTYDVDEQVAQALEAERKADRERVAALETERNDAQSALKVAQGELEKRPTADALRAEIEKEARERAELVTEAARFLEDGYKADGKTPLQIKRDALVAEYPTAGWDKEPDHLIDGGYAQMVKTVEKGRERSDRLRTDVKGSAPRTPHTRKDEADQRFDAQYNWDAAAGRNGAPAPAAAA